MGRGAKLCPPEPEPAGAKNTPGSLKGASSGKCYSLHFPPDPKFSVRCSREAGGPPPWPGSVAEDIAGLHAVGHRANRHGAGVHLLLGPLGQCRVTVGAPPAHHGLLSPPGHVQSAWFLAPFAASPSCDY